VLKRLYVDNFRCLSNFELAPAPVAALVGPNGGGKSTVFDVLAALQSLLGGAAIQVGTLFPFLSRTRWNQGLDQTIELEAHEATYGTFRYRLRVHHEASGRDATLDEELTQGGDTLYRFSDGEVHLFGDHASAVPRAKFPADPRRSFLPILEPREDNKRIHAFKNWLASVLLFRLKPDRIPFETEVEHDLLFREGENFVAWYRSLHQEAPRVTAQILADMKSYVPGLQSMRLERFGPQRRALAFDTVVAGKEIPLWLFELSDGQRALLVLYSILRATAQRATLLLFDEPDNFVALAEIQPWLVDLRDRVVEAAKGTLLVISHHPEVIDCLAPDQVLRLWRDEGPTRIRPLDSDLQLSEGLSASEVLRIGLAGES